MEKEISTKNTKNEILKAYEELLKKAKIKEQEAFIKELTTKTNTAESTVKDIAIKALESSSKNRVYQLDIEKREKENVN